MIYQITRPIAYLQIKNMGHKWVFDYIMPLTLSIITIAIILIGNNFDFALIIKENKIAVGLFDIVKSLPGFFIAALAAVATFNRPQLDAAIRHDKKNTPTIKIKRVDQNCIEHNVTVEISRRVFLSMMFAYLTAASLIHSAIYIIYAASGFMGNGYFLTFCFFNVYFIFQFWQIVICTLFGLFYLADKMHH